MVSVLLRRYMMSFEDYSPYVVNNESISDQYLI